MKQFLIFLSIIIIYSCKQQESQKSNDIEHGNETPLKYAKGFRIIDYEDYKVLEIKAPWPNSNKDFQFILDNKKISNSNHHITTPITSIVVTSTTHLPALELLGVENTLIGFPETNFISSKVIRQRINNGHVRELGKNEGINAEVLLDLNPDVVIGFGIDGTNKTFETIQNANIPVIYNGDWVENSPLAKAEWIKFFGVLYNKEYEADSIFNTIEKDYLKAKQLAKNAIHKPTILSGAMYKDIWYLPYGNSTEAQLLRDANTDYLWENTKGSGSIPLSFETVFEKGKDAEIWLSPSNYKSLKALKASNTNYTEFNAFQNKSIYSFSNTTGETGGVLYYELGLSRPDIVLKDIIKICHPNILPDHELFFFKPLK